MEAYGIVKYSCAILKLIVGWGKWLALRVGRLTLQRKTYRCLLRRWVGRPLAGPFRYGDKCPSSGINRTTFTQTLFRFLNLNWRLDSAINMVSIMVRFAVEVGDVCVLVCAQNGAGTHAALY
jgi:hypothetical protein